ncbi:DUF2959 family protein [Roseibacillus ishigakijimensis]|uniref:DUF2959 domain-containing protein n=1 Tax=Roseibacillus ishigakijimensis TaxID=454146 RepID=A0A934RPV1_9BACT|nr:DUF2959 family protein [Roseibacillus ishigakijimensis]MBK1834758.1 DUF2959 domain-containing protein [Roseibacillus ishigakijimensis]
MRTKLFPLLTVTLLLAACSTAYYGAMEKLGYEKRHILVSRVEKAKDSQIEAKEQFSSALDEFIAVSGYKGGELEKMYRRIEKAYEKSEDRAKDVRDRNDAVASTGKALFREWDREIKEFTDPQLAATSRLQYKAAQERFEELERAMRAAESKLEPVLKKFRDQTLFLKHNLNAKAISALETEVVKVKVDVARLIRDMERSIEEADRFIKEMQ